MKAINIKWNTDDEEWTDTLTEDIVNVLLDNLPTEIEIPEGMTDEEEISDYISDKTGFCHYGFELVD